MKEWLGMNHPGKCGKDNIFMIQDKDMKKNGFPNTPSVVPHGYREKGVEQNRNDSCDRRQTSVADEGMVLTQQTLCLEEIKIESCLTCALPGKKMEERFERVR